MQLNIHNHITLEEIQKEFSKHFPNLQLRFFLLLHPDGTTLPNEQIPAESKLEEVRKIHGLGAISLDPQQTVAKLEGDFRLHFGVNAQVFRRAGKSWLETSTTDSWTLEKQNTYGAESMLSVNDSDQPADYSLSDED